ncbi:SDR family NAD(P)-dependent oxidoreductase [Paludibacterium paludis]|uniref:Short-chain dehydrogenase n=1 Tax=Paludibacterium paludis TaxID=1225769 RepID=A0A918NWT9_9NEIS|nr:SDR family NAD(P)-dependent oxidoreductase [Paludibacterium paludis]GGY03072.1 short-chain dehydrogenase [Paludibacterium paludis]
MNTFEGRVAVITGAAEGIGLALARRAAGLGMKLVLADRHEARLQEAVDTLTAAGADAVPVVVDVSDAASVEELAREAYRLHGKVHLLINNAGVALAKTAWETSNEDWRWVMGVNFYGVANGVRSFVPRMLESGEEGHIVNTASVAGLISQPGLAAYNASKFGVVTLSEGLMHDLTLRGARIGVSVLCPGWVKTRIAQAERHRPPDERSRPEALDPKTLETAMAVMQAVENGLSAEDVARMAFEAVGRGEFYILTHPHSRAGVKVRLEDILNNRAPTLLPV